MKLSQITFCFLFSLFTLSLNAQEIPDIAQESRTMSMGAKHAFVVAYSDTEAKNVEEQWQKLLKKNKGKVKKNKAKELFADDVKMPDISNNTVDVYATVVENKADKSSVISVWFDLGGAFLNPEDHPAQTQVVKNLLNDLSMRVGAVNTQNILDNEESTLKDLNKDLDKLEKEKENGLKKIEEAKALIAETEKMLEKNAASQTEKKEEIGGQQEAVEVAKKERAKYPEL